jgi:DNA-binding transcriptional LysR family regulator
MGTNKDQLDGMSVFVRVVEKGSFTLAARYLNHSTSYISKELSRLESRLGVRLLNRSTRKISLTDSGRTYYEYCRQIVADAEEAERSISAQHDVPRGTLKISAPLSLGHTYLADLLPQFLKTYPDVQMEVDFDERLVDVIAEGYDVVIRVTNLKDTSLISRKIMSSSIITLASPDYLRRKGCPAHPGDLIEHDCISYTYLQRPAYWDYFSGDGKQLGVTVKPQVVCNDAELQRSMAVAGVGITRLPSFCCQDELSTGALVPILKEYEFKDLGVYALYPHRRHLSAKVRVFVDFLVKHLSS